jgi:hypothetical protein
VRAKVFIAPANLTKYADRDSILTGVLAPR